MPVSLKVVVTLALDFEIRQRAHRTGRTISDTLLKAIEKGFAASPSTEKMPEAIVDRAERGERGRATAAYLSPPLSSGIQAIAQQENRSASWVMRLLIRESLQRRGLLPKPSNNHAVDAAL